MSEPAPASNVVREMLWGSLHYGHESPSASVSGTLPKNVFSMLSMATVTATR